MAEGVTLSVRQQVIFWVIEDFRAGKLTREQAAVKLGISEKSVARKAKRIREAGLSGLAHGNAKRVPVNRSPDALKQQVAALLRDVYFDFNLSHARDKLAAEHGIRVAYGTLHAWARQAGVGRGKRKRRSSRARVHRERMANEGLLLQMDGSHHRWNGKDEWCLIAMIDDATSDIPYAEFFDGETTLACLKVLRRVIEAKGIPDIIYTDEAGWADRSGKRQQFSQFKRACEELGIRLITTRSAEAKGRIERAWRTCQDRLVPEFRLAGVKSMLDGNRYLQQVFLPAYWREHLTVQARSETTRYRPVPAHMNLDQIFCLKYERQVASDNTISYENQRYRIADRRFGSLRKKTVVVHWREHSDLEVYYGHLKLRIERIIAPKRRWDLRPA
jgi:transposase-like protein